MARQDIKMDVALGEVSTSSRLAGKNFYPLSLLTALPDDVDETYAYAEVLVPDNFKLSDITDEGIRIEIPYQACDKNLRIGFSYAETGVRILNPENGGRWFDVWSGYNHDIQPLVSTLFSLNAQGLYQLIYIQGRLLIFSGHLMDFDISTSKSQNEAFLLKAAAGNLYQYPTLGVGLIDFLHSNMENNGLAQKLQEQFHLDNMVIKNAMIDSVTGELLLETIEMSQ